MIFNIIESYNCVLPFNDKADTSVIEKEFGISKRSFKMAVGKLLRDGLIRITENNIELLTEEERKELAAKGTTKDDVVKRKKTQKSFGQTYAGDISKTRNKPEGSSRKEFAGKIGLERSNSPAAAVEDETTGMLCWQSRRQTARMIFEYDIMSIATVALAQTVIMRMPTWSR